MKQKSEKAAHKVFGIVLVIIAIPAAIAFVIVWATTGIGGKLADTITRRRHNEQEEGFENDF